MILNTKENRELLVDTLCQTFSITRAKLMSRTRERHTVMARAIGYKVARDIFGMTFSASARLFEASNGKVRHHTTVIHAIENLNDLASVGDEIVISMTNEVMRKLDQMASKGITVTIDVHPDQLVELTSKLSKWGHDFQVHDNGVNL